jgi:hypothetical protein
MKDLGVGDLDVIGGEHLERAVPGFDQRPRSLQIRHLCICHVI